MLGQPAQRFPLSLRGTELQLLPWNHANFRQKATNEQDCPECLRQREFSLFSCHGSYQFLGWFRCLLPFFCTGAMFMGLNAGAVEAQVLIIGIYAQYGEYLFKHMLLVPLFESGINRFP